MVSFLYVAVTFKRNKKPSSFLEDEGIIALSWYHHHLSLFEKRDLYRFFPLRSMCYAGSKPSHGNGCVPNVSYQASSRKVVHRHGSGCHRVVPKTTLAACASLSTLIGRLLDMSLSQPLKLLFNVNYSMTFTKSQTNAALYLSFLSTWRAFLNERAADYFRIKGHLFLPSGADDTSSSHQVYRVNEN